MVGVLKTSTLPSRHLENDTGRRMTVEVVEVGSQGENSAVGAERVEKYNFSSAIALSVITACHAQTAELSDHLKLLEKQNTATWPS